MKARKIMRQNRETKINAESRKRKGKESENGRRKEIYILKEERQKTKFEIGRRKGRIDDAQKRKWKQKKPKQKK